VRRPKRCGLNHNLIGASPHLPTLSFFVFLHWVEKKPSLGEGFLVVEESNLRGLGEFLSLTFIITYVISILVQWN